MCCIFNSLLLNYFQIQSKKTQGFYVADFATLPDEASCLRLFYCLILIKEPCVQKSEGLTPSKILQFLQTEYVLSGGMLQKSLSLGLCPIRTVYSMV